MPPCVNPVGGRQRRPVGGEQRDAVAGVVADPDAALVVDQGAPADAADAAAGVRSARQRPPGGRVQRGQLDAGGGPVALEVVADPRVAAGVEGHAPRRVQAHAGEGDGDQPVAGRGAQLRRVGMGDLQAVEPLGVQGVVVGQAEGDLQRVGRTRAAGRRGGPAHQRAAAGVGRGDRAALQQRGDRVELRQRLGQRPVGGAGEREGDLRGGRLDQGRRGQGRVGQSGIGAVDRALAVEELRERVGPRHGRLLAERQRVGDLGRRGAGHQPQGRRHAGATGGDGVDGAAAVRQRVVQRCSCPSRRSSRWPAVRPPSRPRRRA